MIELDFIELNLLNKLLGKVKYSDLDYFELNQFANSPITNRIIEKIQIELKPLSVNIPKIENSGISKFEFKLENHVGQAILKRLEYMDLSTFRTITNWNKSEVEKFAKDVLGIIDYEESELNKFTEYIVRTAKEKTSG